MNNEGGYTFVAGHPSLQEWLLSSDIPAPDSNPLTAEKIELGKRLFFDARLSSNGSMSCATCHNPGLGWADGLALSSGTNGLALTRTTPTVVNMAFNSIFIWDGRVATIEDQILGPIVSPVEMNLSLDDLTQVVSSDMQYQKAFSKAYPGDQIAPEPISKALASFVRTVVSNDSPFDRWVKGDSNAMTEQQLKGFKLFVDENKGNCAACHHPPNFTDNGFHNIGLVAEAEDEGRYRLKPLRLMKGAFKTPTLRDVALTAPYFHDGSARTLEEVMKHYVEGGKASNSLSPNMKPLDLNDKEIADLVSFMEALTTSNPPLSPSTVAMGLKKE